MRSCDDRYRERRARNGIWFRDHDGVLVEIKVAAKSSPDVGSVDEIGIGAMHMLGKGYAKGWGLGRHVLGSNYFRGAI